MKISIFVVVLLAWSITAGIEEATPNSGMLPGGEKEKDLVKEGLTKWKDQVRAWIQRGMKCQ